MMKKYRIAIYLRLSKEDDKLKEESASIAAQRVLLKKYAAENFSEYDLQEFCDDGYTGTNFERPAVQAMLEKIRNSGIDCVIVKDFSRFARDYIELGAYLEQIFPFMGVRFISINDGYDSSRYKGSIADIDMNFKNLLYDLYSKDLSEKVRSSLAIRKEMGQYVSGNSPFGYEKNPEDRHGLVIAEDEAEIVRRIFSLTLEGRTSVEIARLFNETRVRTPIEFKIEKGKTSRAAKGERFWWSASTICQILRNEIYIGNIVQKKFTKDFVGGKNHLNPRDKWLVSCGHHEPVIDKDVFDRVQEGRGEKRKPQYRKRHPLMGKLVCGCCKKNLALRSGLNPYFSCRHRYSNTMKNCVDKVNAMFIEQYVLFMVQEKLRADGELEQCRTEAVLGLERDIREQKERRQLLAAQKERMQQRRFEAYQSYAAGKTGDFPSDEFTLKPIEEELADIDSRLQELETAYAEITYAGKKRAEGRERLEIQFATLEIAGRCVDKIEVHDEQHIKIFWKENVGIEF